MSTSREHRPRVGFAGLGWIGRNRLEGLAASGDVEIAAIVDPDPAALAAAGPVAPAARTGRSFEDLFAFDLDGVVIATPSAHHAGQAIRALEHGLAVFCQKPLARTAAETRAVVDAAKDADRLLAVDLSYRFTAALQAVRQLVREGALGDVFAVDLTFHNAYGPDKAWYYSPDQAGGGCVMDLGVHLVDLLVWLLGKPIERVDSQLHSSGKPLPARSRNTVEDYAVATLDVEGGAVARLACSWRLPAGRDAVIEVACFGTRGGARVANVNGSFHDFVAERFDGTRTATLVSPPDAWSARAACDWGRRLARGDRFDPEAESLVEVARVLDAIYERPSRLTTGTAALGLKL